MGEGSTSEGFVLALRQCQGTGENGAAEKEYSRPGMGGGIESWEGGRVGPRKQFGEEPHMWGRHHSRALGLQSHSEDSCWQCSSRQQT